MIKKIELENYRCYSTHSITFNDGLNVIAGENGSGKTTIVEAIAFALFGNKLTRGKANAWVSHGKKHGKVVLHLDNYIITRGDNEQHVATTDGEIIARQHVGIDEWMEATYGLNADLFSTSNYIAQKDIESFSGLQPAEKIKRIEKLLRIDVLDSIKDNSKAKLKLLRSELRSMENKLKNAVYEPDSIDTLQASISSFEKELQTKEDQYDDVLKNYLSYEQDLTKWNKKKSLIDKTKDIIYKDIPETIAELLEFERKVKESNESYLELQSIPSNVISQDLSDDLVSLRDSYVKSKTQYEELRDIDKNCPTCNQEIPDFTEISAKRDKAKITMKDSEEKGKIASISTKKFQLEQKLFKCKYADISKVIEDYNKSHYLEELEDYKEVSNPKKPIDSKEFKAEISKLKSSIFDVKNRLKRKEEGKIVHDTYSSIVVETKESIDKIVNFVEFIDNYRREFSKNIVPLIETNASKIFKFITDNKYEDFSLDSSYNIVNYDTYSGSEADTASLALRMAIAHISRIGSFNSIILDEVASSFDHGKESLLVELLETTKQQIIYISHGSV